MFNNFMLLTDSYKVSHWKQYPPGTEIVYSSLEPRMGGKFPLVTAFGYQYPLKRYFEGVRVSRHQINYAREFWKLHFGQDLLHLQGWERILKVHDGHLPLRIKAVPEGMRIPQGNVMMTVENTDPEVPWLTNWAETLLSQVWYPCTVATQSRAMKEILLKNLQETGDPSLISFKLHDFGFRGSTSVESAAIGGCAHLVNFLGTDTTPGLQVAREIYHEEMAGFSIPAAEHSTITSWGRDHEVDAFRNMLEQFPSGLVAVVSDSYDIFHACETLWGRDLKDQVHQRDGCLVIRPDSGELPLTVIRVMNILGEQFGFSENSKGYRVLHPKVRVIQGDGIDLSSLESILNALKGERWSGDNIAFGSGGGLLQKVDRDTCKFAFKCSAIRRNGKWEEVFKSPITDEGKKSKRGRLALIQDADRIWTLQNTHGTPDERDLLTTIFENGRMVKEWTFKEIRGRA